MPDIGSGQPTLWPQINAKASTVDINIGSSLHAVSFISVEETMHSTLSTWFILLFCTIEFCAGEVFDIFCDLVRISVVLSDLTTNLFISFSLCFWSGGEQDP